MKYMFDVPSDPTVSKITITREVVEGGGEPVFEHNGPSHAAGNKRANGFIAKNMD